MKITDTLGRELHIDVATQGPRGWMVPLGYNIEDVPTRFVRVPHGPFALRVMSKDGAELLIHLNGERIMEASVPGGIHFIECASDGKPFVFSALAEGATDECTARHSTFAPAEGEDAEAQPALEIPRGHGLLFVVARFAPDLGPAPHPPRQEYLFVFQMNTGEDHDRKMAGNLRRVVQPEESPNPDDLTSREAPAQGSQLKRTCLTCGREH